MKREITTLAPVAANRNRKRAAQKPLHLFRIDVYFLSFGVVSLAALGSSQVRTGIFLPNRGA